MPSPHQHSGPAPGQAFSALLAGRSLTTSPLWLSFWCLKVTGSWTQTCLVLAHIHASARAVASCPVHLSQTHT